MQISVKITCVYIVNNYYKIYYFLPFDPVIVITIATIDNNRCSSIACNITMVLLVIYFKKTANIKQFVET